MTSAHRQLPGLVAILLTLSLLPTGAFAQDDSLSLVFEPHCTSEDRSSCPEFETADASHLKTSLLRVGDILDIDVVLKNAQGKGVSTVRSWLTYDSNVLEARSVELTNAIQAPTPDEQTIESTSGLVKIGGAVGDIQNQRIAIARVTFRVITDTQDTMVGFSNFLTNGNGQTAVNAATSEPQNSDGSGLAEPPCVDELIGCRGNTNPLLTVEPTKLTVTLTDGTQNPPSTIPTTTNTSSEGTSASSVPAVTDTQTTVPGSSTFTLLQVQNVRVTTRDQQIFLGWDALRSSELSGYNIYYGTVSGKYIQRRSIPSSATSLVLRDLALDSTYFLAVRAFSTNDQETVFSQEVSVTVGKPETSSSPLLATVENTEPVNNVIEEYEGEQVSGTTGTSDTILYLAIASATIGTLFAFARQLSLRKHTYAA
jgi:hypothetical protein